MIDEEKISLTHIPAQPGWFVGSRQCDESGTCAVFWEPVIAWAVRTSELRNERTVNWTQPIGIDCSTEGDDYVLRTPSGVIHVPECCIMSEAEVVAYWRKLDERKLSVRK